MAWLVDQLVKWLIVESVTKGDRNVTEVHYTTVRAGERTVSL